MVVRSSDGYRFRTFASEVAMGLEIGAAISASRRGVAPDERTASLRVRKVRGSKRRVRIGTRVRFLGNLWFRQYLR